LFLICFHILSSLSLIIFCIATKYFTGKQLERHKKTNENRTIDQISDEEFIKWIKSDDHEDNDYFETEKNYKNQIKTSIESNGNILLFGDYGIGKSWLLKKIEKELSEEKKSPYIFCFIDSWGRDVKSLPEQILSKILYEISSVVDITHLQCIPSAYQEALSKSSNIIESILKIGVSDYNPEKVVERLDETLRIINKKVVVVIEDLDRNPNPKGSLLKIEPLLDRFKNSENIQFILTISKAEEVDQEINRIIDNKITLVINEDSGIYVFKRFRNLLINLYKDGYIDPYTPEEREKQKNEFHFTHEKWLNLYGLLDSSKKPLEDIIVSKYIKDEDLYIFISKLNNTPRKIKRLLNEVWQTWNQIKGEFEIDGLISLCALKNQDFKMYKEILSNSESFLFIETATDQYTVRTKGKKEIDIEREFSSKSIEYIVSNKSNKSFRQPPIKEEYLERIQTLKTDKFSDQKLLKLGKDYFEDGTKTAVETFEIIEENNLHERLLPLWRKYIYSDKEINGLYIATSDDMHKKIEPFLIEMIKNFSHNPGKQFSDYQNLFNLLNPTFQGLTPEKRKERFKPIIEELIPLCIEKNGLLKFDAILSPLLFSDERTLLYNEHLRQEAIENKNFVKMLIENNNPETINTFLLSFSTSQQIIEFDIEKRQQFSWLLDGILDLAKTGNKKAVQMIYNLIILNLIVLDNGVIQMRLILSKIQNSEDDTENIIQDSNIYEKSIKDFIKNLYPENMEEIKKIIAKNHSPEIAAPFSELMNEQNKDNFLKYWEVISNWKKNQS